MTSRCPLLILPDAMAVSYTAADAVQRILSDAVEQRGSASIALAGGSTPLALYRVLGTPRLRNAIQWNVVQVFWGDERCVPPDHPDSNYGAAKTSLLNTSGIPDTNTHRIRGEDTPEEAAAAYESLLREVLRCAPDEVPALDLALLGIGNDGHTASLFPGGRELHEQTRLVTAVVKTDGTKRLSMTLPLLNRARNVVFLVCGEAKAKTLFKAMGEPDDAIPASLIRPEGRLLCIADRAAAQLVS